MYLYDNITFAKCIDRITVKVELSSNNFNRISVIQISPANNRQEFSKYSDNKLFYSRERGFVKRILVSIPSDIYSDVLNLKIKIGKKEFIINKVEIDGKWRKEIKNDFIELYSPQNIRSAKSVFPLFKDIINWKGDIELFVYGFICIFILVTAGYFLFSKYYIFLNKNYITIFFSMLFFIIFFALLQRMSLNQLPICDSDSYAYLNAPLTFFEKGYFQQAAQRSISYSIFLLTVLSIFRDFSYISVIQHCIGILTGVLLLIIWRRIFFFFSKEYQNKLLVDILGFVLMASYLFSENSIMLEHYMLRESIYPFFLLMQVLFFINMLIFFQRNNNKYFYINIFLFSFNNFFLFNYQPRWGFTLFFNIVVAFIFFIKLKDTFFKKIFFIFILPVIFYAILIYSPEKIFKEKGKADTFLSGTLFSVHANIIDIELKKDINNKDFIKYDSNQLIKIRTLLKEVFENNEKRWKIGFNADAVLYGETNKYLFSIFDDRQYNKFCRYYFLKSIYLHPLLYLKKIINKLAEFYNFERDKYERKKYKIDNSFFSDSYSNLNKNIRVWTPFLEYASSIENLKDITYDFNKIRFPFNSLVLIILSRSYLIFFVLFLFFFIKKTITREISQQELLLCLIILTIFSYNLFINLTCSMIHTLHDSRYIADQIVLALLTEFLTIGYLINNFKNVFNKIKRITR